MSCGAAWMLEHTEGACWCGKACSVAMLWESLVLREHRTLSQAQGCHRLASSKTAASSAAAHVSQRCAASRPSLLSWAHTTAAEMYGLILSASATQSLRPGQLMLAKQSPVTRRFRKPSLTSTLLQVYLQRGKLLLALQAVRKGIALAGQSHPQVHHMAVQLCQRAQSQQQVGTPPGWLLLRDEE